VGGTWDILVRGRKVDILWWQESEIFWAVGGEWDISVCVRKVCILWWEESGHFWLWEVSGIF